MFLSGLDNPMHYVGYMRSSIYDYLQPYCLITSPSPVDYVTSRWSGFSLSRRVEIICETATCVAFFDGYPVSPGHALIVPKRHVSSYFDLTDHEREAMNVMLQYVKRVVDERFHPDGYNIGIMLVRQQARVSIIATCISFHDMPATWRTRRVESGELYQRN